MEGNPQAGSTPVETPVSSRAANAGSGLVAVVALLALLDAGVETLLSGSPLRWWIAPAVLVFVALSVWLWRPGSWAAQRWGWPGAASWSAGGLLLLLAVTAWLPEGQTNGVRIFLQPTPRLLTSVLALAVLLGGFVLVRGVGSLPATPKLIARSVFIALALYALVSLGLALRDNTPFALLFQGGALWQRLPCWLQGAFLGSFVLLPLALLVQLALTIRQPRGTRGHAGQPVALALSAAIALAGHLAVGPDGRVIGTTIGATATTLTVSDEDTIKASAELRAAVLTAPDGSPLTAALAGQRLQYLLEQFATLEREMPSETFDPQAVVDSVGRDPALLLAWVRDRTFWIPYRGALRGPVGVLMDRVGNSLDRGLLLAELLRLAGHSVRLAHAELTPDQMRILRDRLSPVPALSKRVPPAPPEWSTRPDQVLQQYARQFQKEPEALLTTVARLRQIGDAKATGARRQSAAHAQALRTALGNPQRNEHPADDTKELADHWWVQYNRDGQWIDCDPGLRDAAAGQATAAAQSTVAPGSLPESQYWTVGVRVVVERWSQGQLAEQTVLAHRLRAVDAIRQDITLLHAPKDFPKGNEVKSDVAGKLRPAILGVGEWLPVLVVGDKPIAGSSFRNDGSINQHPGQGAVVNPGNLLGSLMGGDVTASAGVLTAEWIDYEIQGPGSQPSRMRRESFDLVGPAARARRPLSAPSVSEAERLQRGLSLLGQTAILVQVAQPSPEFLAHRLIRRFLENQTQILALAKPDSRVSGDDAKVLLARLAPRSYALWQYAALRFENNALGGDVYLDRPSIAALHSTIALSPDQRIVRRERFDIVSNRVAVRAGSNSPPFRVRIDQGVADTIAERLVLDESSTAENTAVVFAAASAQGVGPVVVRSPAAADGAPPGLPADVLARVRADLSDGYDVVMPGRMVTLAGVPRMGWWRVAPDEGISVGVMDTGFRQGFVEHIDIHSFVLAFALALFLDESSEAIDDLQIIYGPSALMYMSDILKTLANDCVHWADNLSAQQ